MAAVRLASAEIEQWSGNPATVRVRIAYKNQLTETSHDPTALEQVHSTDLRRIEDVWFDVETDANRWREQMDDYNEHEVELRLDGHTDEAAALAKPATLVLSSVSFRLENKNPPAIHVEVLGSDRTNVEGLTARLEQILNRSASGPTKLPREWAGPVAIPAALLTGVFASYGVHAFNLAPVNGRTEWQEIVIPFALSVVVAGIFASVAWIFPGLELLDRDERSRYRRYRSRLISGLGAIIAGLITAAILLPLS